MAQTTPELEQIIRRFRNQLENKGIRIEQILLFTVFTPATNFGLPVNGQVRISVDRNVVLVQG